MNKRNKKIKTDSNKENCNETVVQKTKKTNSKTNHLKDRSNCKEMKNASKNKSESRKSKMINKIDTPSTSSSNTKVESVGYEEGHCTSAIDVENSSNLPDTDDNEVIHERTSFKDSGRRRTKMFFNKNQSILSNSKSQIEYTSNNIVMKEKVASKNKAVSKKSKNKTDMPSTSSSNTKKESVGYEEGHCTLEIIVENSLNLRDTDDNEVIHERTKLEKVQNKTWLNGSKKLEDEMKSHNTKIKMVEPELKQWTVPTTEYSYNLPDKNVRTPNKNAFFKVMNKRIKEIKTDTNKENCNETVVQKTKKSNSKTNHLKDRLNCKEMKNASKNKSESRKGKIINKTDTPSTSSSNTKVESVGYEEGHCTSAIDVENSSKLADTDDNEVIHERTKLEIEQNKIWVVTLKKLEDEMKSHYIKIKTVEPETKQWTVPTTENSSNLCDKNEKTPNKSAVEMESVGYEEEQDTEKTIVDNTSILLDTDDNESILTESVVKMESVGYAEEQGIGETIVGNTTILPDTDDNESVKLDMECSSNCQHKRKLSKLEDFIQDTIKRFKSLQK